MTTQSTQTIPQGWIEITLGEVAGLIKEQWKPGYEEQKYIGLEHINQGDLQINGYGYSLNLESNKFYFRKGDILFGKLRPYFRKVWKATFDGVCSTDIWVIRSRENYDQNYLFYFMANPIVIDKSSGASTGTKMPRADWNFLGNTEWIFPDIHEQRVIAAVLSALDDKIELLRKQNKTLENIAQTLFKRWFVDFEFPNEKGKPYKSSGGKMIESELGKIPEGWRVGLLRETTINITKGTTPTTVGGSFSSSGINFIKAESIKDNHEFDFSKFSFVNNKTNQMLKRSIIEEEDVLYTIAGTIGRNAVVTENILPANTNQAVAIIRINKEIIDPYYLRCFFDLKSTKETLFGNIVEAVQANLSLTSLKECKMAIPDRYAFYLFSTSIRPLFNKINHNNSQIQTLSRLRDSLLPKLMKGKVRVKGF